MIEGSLNDISLPSLLQLLCIESGKEFRLVLAQASHRAEVLVKRGWIMASTFGILEGEDSLCELLSWREGQFWGEQLSTNSETPRNMVYPFQASMSFTQDATYLAKQVVGLNSVISGSILFGSTAWKELVRQNPLDREALSILAWLREGRSMRQAMREFDLDLLKATGILRSLVITKSVDVIRMGREDVDAASVDSSEGLEPVSSRKLTTGEQEIAAAQLAQEAAKSFENLPAISEEAFLSTSFRADSPVNAANQQTDSSYNVDRVPDVTAATSAEHLHLQGRSSVEARLRAKRNGASTLNRIPVANGPQFISGPNAAITPPGGTTKNVPPLEVSGQNPSFNAGVESKPKTTGLDALLRNAHKRNIESAIESNADFKGFPPEPSFNRLVPRHTETAEIDTLKVPVPHDDPRFTSRTVALPLVALDIERLLSATFSATQFGRMALGNPSLDAQRRQSVQDAEYGTALAVSIEEGTRSPSAILSSCKYCLDRGYITTADPVLALTIDLLLGRMEIDQYLLQRRRISGDQLRDLTTISIQEGIKLPQLLVKGGFLTEGDIETLLRERRRFGAR